MKIRSVLLLLLLNTSTLHAESSSNSDTIKTLIQYDIEVIIFEDAHARYINSEIWPQQDGADITETLNENIQITDENTDNTHKIDDITALDKLSLSEIENIDKVEKPAEDLTRFDSIEPSILLKEHDRISRSSEYNVLYYASWRQNGLPREKAVAIDINDLTNFHPLISTQVPAKSQHEKEQVENHISGTLKVVLARYLHFYSELEYERFDENEAQATAEPTEQPAPLATIRSQRFKISSHRRMRSKVLHYIDHPLVGILIQINPVPKEKIKE